MATAAEILKSLERVEVLVTKRPKFWQNHAVAALRRARQWVAVQPAAVADELPDHIGIAPKEPKP